MKQLIILCTLVFVCKVAHTQLNPEELGGMIVYYDGNRKPVPLLTTITEIGPTLRTPMLRFGFMPCSCEGLTCGCCVNMNIQTFNFEREGCMKFTYDPYEFSIGMNMLFDNSTIYENSVSAKNPPPLCMQVPVPYIPSVDFCVRLYNIFTPGRNLHMCVNFETKLIRVPVLVLQFDCVKMGADGVSLWKPEENAGIMPQVEDIDVTENAESVENAVTAENSEGTESAENSVDTENAAGEANALGVENAELVNNSEDFTNSTVTENAAVVENAVDVENAELVNSYEYVTNSTGTENAAYVENAADVENAAVVENAVDVENAELVNSYDYVTNSTGTENAAYVENNAIVENAVDVENAELVNNSEDMTNSTDIENVADVKNAAIFENSVDVQNAEGVENFVGAENATVVENAADVENTETAKPSDEDARNNDTDISGQIL